MATAQERFVARIRAQAKAAGQPLGPHAEAATRRPANYCELDPQSQWTIDKSLGVLDWEGEWNR